MKKAIAAILITALMIGGFYWVSPYRAQKQRPTVRLCAAQVSSVQDTVTLYGTVKEKCRRQYYSSGAAEVLRCYVKEGDSVKKGDPLLKLRKLEDVQAQSAADAAALQSVLELLQAGELDAAEESLEAFSMQSQTTVEEVYTIYSDLDGTVMSVRAAEGESISQLLSCVEISDLTQLEIQATADESTVGKLRENQSCTIRIPAFSLSGLSGSVRSIQPYATQVGWFTGSSAAETTVCIDLHQSIAALRPGYSATVRVTTQVLPEVLLVPYACIGQDEDNREYVFTVSEHKLCKHLVSTGLELEDSVEVCGGITQDALLVLDPDQYEEGMEVFYEMD